MPAKDVFHNAVKNALIKDGWKIIDENYTLQYGEDKLYADLAAEKILVIEKQSQKIIVEVKSFLGRSFINDLENAIGQYIVYRDILSETEPQFQLYLAISSGVYESNFQKKLPQMLIKRNQVKLLIFNANTEVIEQWIN
jgi:hypothetical protein